MTISRVGLLFCSSGLCEVMFVIVLEVILYGHERYGHHRGDNLPPMNLGGKTHLHQ